MKIEKIAAETARINDIFADVDPLKRDLVQGLIADAAFLKVENDEIKKRMLEVGMVQFHPSHPSVQKTTEAAKQYLKNCNSYAVIIKTLNGILSKNVLDSDDGLGEFE